MQSNEIVQAVFNLGPGEILLIVLVLLLLFGAKRLPGLAKGLGQGIREFKGAVDGAKKEIQDVGDSITKEEKTEKKEEKK
ncbi:MAG: twin-arginine translocase TatA/TatE family subunit, partial [Candidatus Marinimicrobia bacterium]|nr:twin-arginine translocase TatA/TatE family subunit [Candidatus Neomarinimicrobiota bacterium]